MTAAANSNTLRDNVDYITEHTAHGVWRRFFYSNGQRFAEFTTHLRIGGLPLVHYTYGICPQTGRRVTAKGFVAVGRIACGGIAVGQMATGLIAIGQLSIGLLLAIGQASFGAFSLGQLAIGLFFSVGQFAVGQTAIGQFAYGAHVLAQFGFGKYVVDIRGVDPAAKAFFLHLIGK